MDWSIRVHRVLCYCLQCLLFSAIALLLHVTSLLRELGRLAVLVGFVSTLLELVFIEFFCVDPRQMPQVPDTSSVYVRGEENLRGWRPRGTSLLLDHEVELDRIYRIHEVSKTLHIEL